MLLFLATIWSGEYPNYNKRMSWMVVYDISTKHAYKHESKYVSLSRFTHLINIFIVQYISSLVLRQARQALQEISDLVDFLAHTELK